MFPMVLDSLLTLERLDRYFRHSTTPRFVHMPAVAMPLTWTYYAIFWNGAIMGKGADKHCMKICTLLTRLQFTAIL